MIKGKLKSKYAGLDGIFSEVRTIFQIAFTPRLHPPPPPPKKSLIEDLVTLSALEFFLHMNDFVGCLSPLTDARQLFITR